MSDQALSRLLTAFEAGTELVEGGLRYLLDDFLELYEILPDAYSVRPPISRAEAVRLFGRALRLARSAGPLTGEAVRRHAEAVHHEDLAKPPLRYTIWTKLRATQMHASPGFRLEWRSVRARSAAALPSWLAREDYLLNGVGRIRPNRPAGFGYVILSCEEREEGRAVDRMMDALQLMQGLLNLYETWGRWTPWGGRNWMEGSLWLGPNQFLFRERAFRGDSRIWYNLDFDQEAWNRYPPRIDRILQVVPLARDALRALEGHPFVEPLIKAVMLLQEGFAERDGSRRLLRYWSALEQLYVEANDRNRSNEKVIERSLFAEADPTLTAWKLEHIARIRNDYVHAGGAGDDLHALGQFLRRLVGRHLDYWIFAGRDLTDHAAMLSFVRLPSDRGALVRMRDTVERRLAFVDDAPPAAARR